MNDFLNKPPQTRAGARGNATERSAGASSSATAGLPISALGAGADADDLGALGGLDQTQLMQLLQLMNSGGVR